jgi:hypothetical protein
MDVFFIHGVNKRSEAGHTFAGAKGSGQPSDRFAGRYKEDLDAMRTRLAHACAGAGLEAPRFCPIYWGAHGPRFHFYDTTESEGKTTFRPLVQQRNLSALLFSRKQRSLGPGDPYVDPALAAVAEELALIAGRLGRDRVTLGELVLAAPQPVLEALLAPEHLAHRSGHAERLAASKRVSGLAQRIATDQELRTLLRDTSGAGEQADLALLDLLQRELSRRGEQRPQDLRVLLLSTARRLVSGPIVTELKSQSSYLAAGRFFGDSVRYFAERGSKAEPGPIIVDVKRQIDDYLRDPGRSGPTVYITHSLGGALFYDLFSYFYQELRFDLWVSVGSQLAYYEDAKLLKQSSDQIGAYHGGVVPGVPAKVTAPLPTQARWYNVLDPRDPVGFSAEVAFDNVHDEHVRLDTSDFAEVHSAYFSDDRFYETFTSILKDSLGPDT